MIPGIEQARAVQSAIKRIGIQDVELFYDPQIKMWAVVQVRKTTGGIITMDNLSGTKVEPMIMWWCKNDKGTFRLPNEKDVADVVATVHRAQHWFDKGGDALADALDKQDQAKREAKDKRLKERLSPHIKPLKKAVRKELGGW